MEHKSETDNLNIPGLEKQKAPGDGNCFYHAVALYVGKNQKELRDQVGTHLKSFPEKYKHIIDASGKTSEQFIADIQKNEWADQLEITILSETLKREIVIVGPNAIVRNKDVLDKNFSNEPIFVYYNGHNHYDGLIRKGETPYQAIIAHLRITTTEGLKKEAKNSQKAAPAVQPSIVHHDKVFTSGNGAEDVYYASEDEDEDDRKKNEFVDQHIKLLPSLGKYPLSQATFSTLVMTNAPCEVPSNSSGQIKLDLNSVIKGKTKYEDRFKQPVEALRLTYRQSWFIEGTEISRLLYTFPLAPGEFTRIAVTHWSRSLSAKESSKQNQAERLESEATHQRSIEEINHAVSHEASNGFSKSSSDSTSSQSGSGGGFSLGPFGGGTSSSNGRSSTVATSFMSGAVDKDLATQMAQRISDCNRQYSSAARSASATVVREVQEQEAQKANTRIIGNYNQMYPITLNYYEIAQIFRVEIKLISVEKILLIPIEPIDDFSDELVAEYWPILYQSAKTTQIAEALKKKYESSDATGPLDAKLKGHFTTHKVHYSGAIYAAANTDVMLLLLSGLKHNSLSLATLVDPKPVAVIGNLLGFSLGGCYAEEFQALKANDTKYVKPLKNEILTQMKEYGLSFDHTIVNTITLPTQGVHLEAIRGHNNAKEQIDRTRSSHWGAPPVLPSDINPIQMRVPESHQPSLQPSPMAAPVVKMQKANALPAPIDQTPALVTFLQKTIMEDLAEMQKYNSQLAEAGLNVTGEGASHAATMANKNMSDLLKHVEEKMRIASEFIGSMYGVPPKGGNQKTNESTSQPTEKKQIPQRGSNTAPRKTAHKSLEHQRSSSSSPGFFNESKERTARKAPSQPDCSPTGYAKAVLGGIKEGAQNTMGSSPVAVGVSSVAGGAAKAAEKYAECHKPVADNPPVDPPVSSATPKCP